MSNLRALVMMFGLLAGCSAAPPLKPLPEALDYPERQRASIHGVVVDKSRKPIPGAKVTFPDFDYSVVIVTDADGYFANFCVQQGAAWDTRVEAAGYKTKNLGWVEATLPVTELHVVLEREN